LRVSVYIAKRYLFAKKTHNIINIISAISVFGITIGTAALIIVLSVFNGFENLVVSMFNSFNPDLQVTVVAGKNFREEQIPFDKVYAISGISYVTKVIEENALITYREKQYIATIKGVSRDFYQTSRIDSMIIEGDARLENGDKNFAIVGQGVSYYLGLGLNDFENPLSVYVPRRFKGYRMDPMQAFNSLLIQPSGIFSIQQEYDQKYMIVPLRFARTLLEDSTGLSALEIKMSEGANRPQVQRQLQQLLGTGFAVKDRYQQEEVMYKIMKSEKLAVFIILGFILLIAVFNVIGSLSMLILDKKKDMAVLQSLGASNRLIRQIFFTEGMMITMLGALAGLLLGGVVCWLQQRYGLLTINSGATFVVEAYPVKLLFMDFVYVLGVITLIGFVAAWYPVKYISKKHLEERL
jgi:lipoprotein-releasing system permease protein